MATGGTNRLCGEEYYQQNKFCTGCLKHGKETEAEKFCRDCDNFYCSACVSFHQYTADLSRHRIIHMTPVLQSYPDSYTPNKNTEKSKYQRKIILVGKSGNGKSSLGNNLLGQTKFKADKRLVAVTKYCKKVETESLIVVDTPGLFDEGNIAERALQIQKAVTNPRNCPRPHAILIVFNSDIRPTEEELYTFDLLRLIFGDECLKHVVVVFTHVSNDMSEDAFENFWKESAAMEDLVDKCGNRVARIDNKSKSDVSRSYINRIFELVDDVAHNGTTSFDNKFISCHKEILYGQIAKYTEGQKVHEQIQVIGDTLQSVLNKIEEYERFKSKIAKGASVAALAMAGAYVSKKTSNDEHKDVADSLLRQGLEAVLNNPQTVALLTNIIRDVVNQSKKE